VGVGLPLAEAVKLAVWPTSFPIVAGWVVIDGAEVDDDAVRVTDVGV
jgi:hypothetical protein